MHTNRTSKALRWVTNLDTAIDAITAQPDTHNQNTWINLNTDPYHPVGTTPRLLPADQPLPDGTTLCAASFLARADGAALALNWNNVRVAAIHPDINRTQRISTIAAHAVGWPEGIGDKLFMDLDNEHALTRLHNHRTNLTHLLTARTLYTHWPTQPLTRRQHATATKALLYLTANPEHHDQSVYLANIPGGTELTNLYRSPDGARMCASTALLIADGWTITTHPIDYDLVYMTCPDGTRHSDDTGRLSVHVSEIALAAAALFGPPPADAANAAIPFLVYDNHQMMDFLRRIVGNTHTL